ncbi:M56 family metallopeptidase [Streptomyces sp. NPDC003691]
MIQIALLTGYLVVCAIWMPRLLSGAAWTSRYPRAALAVWAGLLAAVCAAVAALGLTALGHLLWSGAGFTTMRCCTELGRAALSNGLAVFCAAGAAVLAGVVLRGIVVATGTFRRLRKGWRGHVAVLDLLARPLPGLPAVALEHAAPAAYCVPARGGRVVLTSGALNKLPPASVAAVVEHERAHLRGRHHLMAAVTVSLARAFPRVPLFRLARPATAWLVELAADDHASRRCRSETVATALSVLTAAPAGTVGLQAAADSTGLRIVRLRRAPATGAGQTLAATGGFLTAVAPTALAVARVWTGGC